MGGRLQESYADLEHKVEQRTAELSESLQHQTATSDVLQVISRSPGDLNPVFQTILERATNICDARFGLLLLFENGGFRRVSVFNLPPAFAETFNRAPIIVPPPSDPLGRLASTHRLVHVADVRLEPDYVAGFPPIRELAELGGARTLLLVPMLKEDTLDGVIAIFRQDVRLFTDKQIDLVTSFASQGVIAIENARLLNELRQRTTELSLSLDELRTAQDRLVQTEKLASLGQLTAGIAHEIKNPLNFVNNFSSLSAELIDELNDVLRPAALDDKTREEIDELTLMLKGNLEKVVQHGKRADSIVKNMLLHSREGSGEHRPADINAIVEESLNLAYHGARAEKSGFNITLQRDFDSAAGMIDLYPQEITRVFLNLISNGFYAAAKRKETGEAGFEPMLKASTKNLGNKVEIRIRDNGTGIPLEVKEKMFNPFFTTKPAGEGTGLGLSMSHDIIVKQHAGTIDVETEPGVFTEFIITLPRTAAVQGVIEQNIQADIQASRQANTQLRTGGGN
jgi:signal transduction histidine kinase